MTARLWHISKTILRLPRKSCDDDAESIITNERYLYIASIIKGCYKKKNVGQLSTSDKIDRVVTNRWLGLPIFALVMFLVYYISMVTVGSAATDWANDGLFGDGWHLFGIGSKAYEHCRRRLHRGFSRLFRRLPKLKWVRMILTLTRLLMK